MHNKLKKQETRTIDRSGKYTWNEGEIFLVRENKEQEKTKSSNEEKKK